MHLLFLRNLNESLSTEKTWKKINITLPTTTTTNKAANTANDSGDRKDGPPPRDRGPAGSSADADGPPGPAGGRRRPTPAAALDADGMGGSFSRSFSFSPSSSSSSSPPSSADGGAALPWFSSAPGGSPAPGPGVRSAAAVAAGGLCSDMAPLPAAPRLSPHGSPSTPAGTRAFALSSSPPSHRPRAPPRRPGSALLRSARVRRGNAAAGAAPGRSDTPALRGGAQACRPRRGPGEEGERGRQRSGGGRRRRAALPLRPLSRRATYRPRAGSRAAAAAMLLYRRLVETRSATRGAAWGQRRTRLRNPRSREQRRCRPGAPERGWPPSAAQPRWRGASAARRPCPLGGFALLATGRGPLPGPGRGRGRCAAATIRTRVQWCCRRQGSAASRRGHAPRTPRQREAGSSRAGAQAGPGHGRE